MEESQSNSARRERTRHELTWLDTSIKEWIGDQKAADVDERGQYIGRHKTQLEALDSALLGALDVLTNDVRDETLPAESEVGRFFDQCREVDQAALWLHRVWEYFIRMYAPRRQERWGGLLKAADEVVWSCYRQVFSRDRVKRAGFEQGPTPLPFVEPFYSPAARHSDNPLSGDLELNAPGLTDDLAEYVKGLPVSLLRLPPWCADEPWWLAYVAHEVGHLVQHELGLVGYFREGLEEAAGKNHLSEEDRRRWGRWGAEIFADVFSVMMLGPWSLWAIVEAEWTVEPRMRQRRATYPAPLIRVALMDELAKRLGLPTKTALRGLDPPALVGNDPRARADLGVVAAAVDFALAPLPNGLGPLRELCGFDAAAFGQAGPVSNWAQELRGGRALNPSRQLQTARLVVGGAVQAWSEVMGTDKDSRDHLARRTKEALRLSAPPGTRGGLQPSGKLPDGGRRLAELVRRAGREKRSSDEDD